MKNKLLNILKNLIIIIALVSIGIAVLSTSVFAVVSDETHVNISQYIKPKIAAWYLIIRNACLGLMLLAFLMLGIKYLLMERTPETWVLFRKAFVDWIIGLILILFVVYFMDAIMELNTAGITLAKKLGTSLSGISGDANEEEYSLYEEAFSKAYEFNAASGMLGLVMYTMLVIYTFKFIIVYFRRYINVIVLILFAPIVIFVSTLKKLISGVNPGLLKRWFKEYIYNVLIQAIHAIYYASCIGLTLRFSAKSETYIGSILTLILFGFIFKIDGYIRKIFNTVGGKSTIKRIDIPGTFSKTKNMFSDYSQGKGTLFNKQQELQNRFQNFNAKDAVTQATVKFANNVNNTLDAKNVNVTAKEYVDELKRSKDPQTLADKALYGTNNAILTVSNEVSNLSKKAKKISEKFGNQVKKKLDEVYNDVKKNINGLEENVEMVKRIPAIIKSHKKKKKDVVVGSTQNPELQELYQTVIDLDSTESEIINQIKARLESGSKDMIAIIYDVVGPQAFLYPEVGSPYMGMQMLAEQNYENKLIREYSSTYVEQRTLSLPAVLSTQNDTNNDEDIIDVLDKDGNVIAENIGAKSKKTYKFNRFGSTSTKTIVHRLEKHAILNDSYLKVINNVSGKIDLGKLTARGNVGVREVDINYKAEAKIADIKKQEAILKLTRFEERREDGKWAQISSYTAEGQLSFKNNLQTKLVKLKEAPASKVAMQTLVRMGKAYNIDEKIALVANDVTKAVVKPVAPAYNKMKSASEKVSKKLDKLNDTVKDVKEAADILKSTFKSEEPVHIHQKEVPQDTIEVKEASYDRLTQEEKEQAIADKILVEVAINEEIYDIKKLDLIENEDIGKQVIDSLIENGIINSQVKDDENAQNEILESMQERTVQLSEQKSDIVITTIAQQEYAEIVKNAINSGEITENNIDELDITSKLDNLSEVIEKAAREAIAESAREQEESKAQAKWEKDVIKEAKKANVTLTAEDLKNERLKPEKKKDKKSNTSQEEEMCKVTLKFSGAVETQFISITMSNKDTISDFYVKAKPLPTASKSKTQAYFNKVYASKLNGASYSFDKYASSLMDGWEIHVVDERENIDGDDSNKEEEKLLERLLARESLEDKIKRCMPTILKLLEKFIEDRKISSLEEIPKDAKLKTELVSKLARELRREEISRIQLTSFVERLDHYKEIRDLMLDLQNKEEKMAAKQKAKELILEQKNNMTVVKLEESIDIDEEETKEDRKREERVIEAEAENDEQIDQASLDVIQSIFETMNSSKILAEVNTEKQKARQQLYMDFFNDDGNQE